MPLQLPRLLAFAVHIAPERVGHEVDELLDVEDLVAVVVKLAHQVFHKVLAHNALRGLLELAELEGAAVVRVPRPE